MSGQLNIWVKEEFTDKLDYTIENINNKHDVLNTGFKLYSSRGAFIERLLEAYLKYGCIHDDFERYINYEL